MAHLEAILAPAMAAGTRDAIKGAPPPLRAALILGSPDSCAGERNAPA